MIKYNDDNIFVGQIKQVLHTFNLPRCSVYKEGMTLCPSLHYIKDNGIYLCDESKQLVRETSYNFGEPYEGITTTLKLTNNVYDSYTHKYLGNYLRFLRDYAGVNLMSMYNCFSNELAKNLNVTIADTNDNPISEFNSNSKGSVIYAVPIRFNSLYSIFANINTSIEVVAGFYSFDSLLDNGIISNTYARTRRITLSEPFVYEGISNYTPVEEDFTRENCLCLFVKVPASFKNSIVILEGDYSSYNNRDISTNRIYNGLVKLCPVTYKEDNTVESIGSPIYVQGGISLKYGEPVKNNPKLNNFDVYSELELTTYVNSTANYLVASRLIEYISENAITSLSEGYDIKKVQKELISNNYVDSDFLGEWSKKDSDGIVKVISDFDLSSKYLDLTGFVDKDVETALIGIPHPDRDSYLN